MEDSKQLLHESSHFWHTLGSFTWRTSLFAEKPASQFYLHVEIVPLSIRKAGSTPPPDAESSQHDSQWFLSLAAHFKQGYLHSVSKNILFASN